MSVSLEELEQLQGARNVEAETPCCVRPGPAEVIDPDTFTWPLTFEQVMCSSDPNFSKKIREE
jgi:hypothetical protein